jgi:hypothetical protein
MREAVKSIAKTVAIFSAITLVSGCAHAPPNRDTLTQHKTAFITFEGRRLGLCGIDGKTLNEIGREVTPRWLRWIAPSMKPLECFHKDLGEVEAGEEHFLTIGYQNNVDNILSHDRIVLQYTFKAKFEPGKHYVIKSDSEPLVGWRIYLNYLIRQKASPPTRIWIVDSGTNKDFGEVMKTEREPLDPGTTSADK